MGDSVEFLQEYRDKMDFPVELLASTLGDLGCKGEGAVDCDVVDVATRKLRTLHKLVLAGGMNPKMLEAIMAE
jgi:hypothetical protein